MKLLRLQVHHVGGCKDVDLDLSGHHLFLVGGRNGSGKTSAVKSLLMAICGRSELRDYWPAIPLQTGQDEGFVKVQLSGDDELQDDKGFEAELRFMRKRDGSVKEEFVLKDSDGDPAPEPRTLLQRLYSMRMFDPTGFDRLRPKEQRAELARLFPQLDFSKQDAEIKRLYDERTNVNREGKALKARVDAIQVNGDVPDEEVVVADLMRELKSRRSINDANNEKRHGLDTLKREMTAAGERFGNCTALVDQLRRNLNEAEQSLIDAKLKCDELSRQVDVEQRECDALCDQNTCEVEEQVFNAQKVNEQVRQTKSRQEGEAKLSELHNKSETLCEMIKEIEQSKITALREAQLPVQGLGVDSEGLTFGGLPFEQAPKSKRFLVGCMIGMSGEKPKLPLLVCEHGDGLDWETLAEFDKMLEANDWQAVIEVCSKSEADDEHCQVIMEAGQAKKRTGKKAATKEA